MFLDTRKQFAVSKSIQHSDTGDSRHDRSQDELDCRREAMESEV